VGRVAAPIVGEYEPGRQRVFGRWLFVVAEAVEVVDERLVIGTAKDCADNVFGLERAINQFLQLRVGIANYIRSVSRPDELLAGVELAAAEYLRGRRAHPDLERRSPAVSDAICCGAAFNPL
jgi:hypothetical protein